MKKTIGVLAHVDAGKTTFCEQILYNTKAIRNRGRVDNKDTFLDNNIIERERGITIFSEQASFVYGESTYHLIDTPGHIDFSQEMERVINIMDYATIVISGTDKIQAHTKTVFRLLNNKAVPSMFFVNKCDREGVNIEDILNNIKNDLTKDVFNVSDNLKVVNENIELSTDFIEFIAERDEELLEKYLQDEYDEKLWIQKLKVLIKDRKIYPLMYGSALYNEGIENFLEVLNLLTYSDYNSDDEFLGKVYKIKYDENNQKLTYIKAIRGNIKAKDEIMYIKNGEINIDKINSMRIYNANKYEAISNVNAGDIFTVLSLSDIKTNDFISGTGLSVEELKKRTFNDSVKEMVPTLRSKVIYNESLHIKEVMNYFKILNDEEPGLDVVWDEEFKELSVHVMGKIQIEILKSLAKERFNLEVEFGPCEILYKETIKETTVGYGHFEPLGHYAEVHLLIEPKERNSGIDFISKAHVDDLATGNQNLVKTHIFERNHRGMLAGFNLTDINITLLTGRAHKKHTSGGDFREATFRALRQGIEQVDNILLEPYYKFNIEVHIDYLGRVMSDIQKLSGDFEPPIVEGNKVVITGKGPVKTFMDYSVELISLSKGEASFSFEYDGYYECHNVDEIINNSSYDKNVDKTYTSNSIFCSKGQGYVVKGSEAKEHMHCINK